MPSKVRETEIYRRNAKRNHDLLTPSEREKLLKPYLPAPPTTSTSKSRKDDGVPSIRIGGTNSRGWIGVRKFLRQQLHILVYTIIHAIFSFYVRIRQMYHAVKDRIFSVLYYHHRTPELIQKDVKGLSRLPEHISVVLKFEDRGRGGAGLEILVDELAEIAAWCACVGIPMLSVYEESGILKSYVSATHSAISRKLASYFGPRHPALSLRAPHVPSMESPLNTPGIDSFGSQHLSILLLSREDGRDSLVDLTKTLTEMSQRSKLSPEDISIDLVDSLITESVMGEPDLLVLFSPTVELSGFPPWQLRLTEIFHVQDNHGVGYQVFLRALYNYANAQMRLGR